VQLSVGHQNFPIRRNAEALRKLGPHVAGINPYMVKPRMFAEGAPKVLLKTAKDVYQRDSAAGFGEVDFPTAAAAWYAGKLRALVNGVDCFKRISVSVPADAVTTTTPIERMHNY